MRTCLFASLLVLLAACDPWRVEAPEPDAAFTARAVGFLDGLQGQSFAENREYCGYFGLDRAGAFVASGPEPGGEDWCEARRPAEFDIVASYHTHGAHGVEYWAEVPSPEDVESDMAEGVFGYISTPGGRVWLVDWRAGTATQVCGATCVAQDPDYDPGEAGPVGPFYTRADLAARFGY